MGTAISSIYHLLYKWLLDKYPTFHLSTSSQSKLPYITRNFKYKVTCVTKHAKK